MRTLYEEIPNNKVEEIFQIKGLNGVVHVKKNNLLKFLKKELKNINVIYIQKIIINKDKEKQYL